MADDDARDPGGSSTDDPQALDARHIRESEADQRDLRIGLRGDANTIAAARPALETVPRTVQNLLDLLTCRGILVDKQHPNHRCTSRTWIACVLTPKWCAGMPSNESPATRHSRGSLCASTLCGACSLRQGVHTLSQNLRSSARCRIDPVRRHPELLQERPNRRGEARRATRNNTDLQR